MEIATSKDINEVVQLYTDVIEAVNKSTVKLGWNIKSYPDIEFVTNATKKQELVIIRDGGRIVAAAVVNHEVNDEYNDINWKVGSPADKIATIHALATSPDMRGKILSDKLLKDIELYCKEQGNVAIHLDVIDTNIPAYKLYERNGYIEIDCIDMYYEVVGTRRFWMLEKLL